MADVKLLSDESLKREGFSDNDIEGASSDGFVGEKGGIKYFRAEQEMNIDLGDYKTHEVPMSEQQGDRPQQ